MALLLMGTSATTLLNYSYLVFVLSCSTLILGYYTKHLAIKALISLVLLALVLISFFQSELRKNACFIASLLLWTICALFYLHRVPGFANWLWIDHWQLARDSIPYSSYINLDKGLVGIALFELSRRIQQPKSLQLLNLSSAAKMMISFATVAVVIGIAVLASAVRIDPKLPLLFPLWLAQNCLLVVVPEEALFRGFLQNEVSRYATPWRFNSLAAIIASSVVFGALHFSGGWGVSLLAALAGLGYGLINASSWGLRGASALHTALNAVHFLGFSYPALMRR